MKMAPTDHAPVSGVTELCDVYLHDSGMPQAGSLDQVTLLQLHCCSAIEAF